MHHTVGAPVGANLEATITTFPLTKHIGRRRSRKLVHSMDQKEGDEASRAGSETLKQIHIATITTSPLIHHTAASRPRSFKYCNDRKEGGDESAAASASMKQGENGTPKNSYKMRIHKIKRWQRGPAAIWNKNRPNRRISVPWGQGNLRKKIRIQQQRKRAQPVHP